MTHFTVLVCVDDPAKLEDALAPFDENDENAEHPRWDWWVTGGRWAGSLRVRDGHEDEVITGDKGFSTPDIPPGFCDGGPKRAIDIDRMRADAATRARVRYGEYAKLTEGTPEPLPWKTFTDNISEGNGYTIAQARDEYHSQPRIERLKGSDFTEPFGLDPAEEFACTEDVYATRASAAAVPGYALLATDGRWIAPGEMGWFGASTDEQGDRIGYWEVVNAYIDSLPDDTWLIMTDCHV